MKKEIPYKIYLSEKELPKKWLNIRAFMDKKPAPMLNPETQQPVTHEELSKMFCEELAKQEKDVARQKRIEKAKKALAKRKK